MNKERTRKDKRQMKHIRGHPLFQVQRDRCKYWLGAEASININLVINCNLFVIYMTFTVIVNTFITYYLSFKQLVKWLKPLKVYIIHSVTWAWFVLSFKIYIVKWFEVAFRSRFYLCWKHILLINVFWRPCVPCVPSWSWSYGSWI